MKKVMVVFLLLCMFAAAANPALSSPKNRDERSEKCGDCLLDAETICFIPSGEAEDEVGYEEWDSENVPEGFIVNDDKVYILDSVKHRIILYDNGALSYVPLDTYLHPKYFALTDDGFMVIDNIGETADLLDQKGALIKSIPLPEGTVFTDGLYNRADGIQIKVSKEDPDDIVLYELDGNEDNWRELCNVFVDGDFRETTTVFYPEKFEVKMGINTTSYYIANTSDFVLLGVYEFVPKVPVIMSELTLRKYSLAGEFIGGCVYDLSDTWGVPEQNVFVNDDGEVYTMICKRDGVYITKPNFRTDYCSHMDEVQEEAEAMCSELPLGTKDNTSYTTNTRALVLSRCNAAANRTWTVTLANKTLPYSDVTLPGYVSSASVGTTVTGVPYCWAHYFTSINDFATAQQQGKTTGNTNKTHADDASMVGVDCAGFASYVYGTSDRKNPKKLCESFGYFVNGTAGNSMYECSTSNLHQMDYMVKYNYQNDPDHVVIYKQISDSKFQVFDATTAGDRDKVSLRRISISSMNGYYLKTPYYCGVSGHSCSYNSTYASDEGQHWHYCKYNCGSKSGVASHTLSSSYYYDDLFHWKNCTICGRSGINKTGHTWVPYNSGYRCSVCHMYVNSIPQPNKFASAEKSFAGPGTFAALDTLYYKKDR